MEQYRTEDEQVEALRRWWNENGRSTLAAVVIVLAAGFGWRAWQANEVHQQQLARENLRHGRQLVRLSQRLLAVNIVGTVFVVVARDQEPIRKYHFGLLPEMMNCLYHHVCSWWRVRTC